MQPHTYSGGPFPYIELGWPMLICFNFLMQIRALMHGGFKAAIIIKEDFPVFGVYYHPAVVLFIYLLFLGGVSVFACARGVCVCFHVFSFSFFLFILLACFCSSVVVYRLLPHCITAIKSRTR